MADPPRGYSVPANPRFRNIDVFECDGCGLLTGIELIDGPCKACLDRQRNEAAFRRKECRRAQLEMQL